MLTTPCPLLIKEGDVPSFQCSGVGTNSNLFLIGRKNVGFWKSRYCFYNTEKFTTEKKSGNGWVLLQLRVSNYELQVLSSVNCSLLIINCKMSDFGLVLKIPLLFLQHFTFPSIKFIWSWRIFDGFCIHPAIAGLQNKKTFKFIIHNS